MKVERKVSERGKREKSFACTSDGSSKLSKKVSAPPNMKNIILDLIFHHFLAHLHHCFTY